MEKSRPEILSEIQETLAMLKARIADIEEKLAVLEQAPEPEPEPAEEPVAEQVPVQEQETVELPAEEIVDIAPEEPAPAAEAPKPDAPKKPVLSFSGKSAGTETPAGGEHALPEGYQLPREEDHTEYLND